jgi:hypothetical protein
MAKTTSGLRACFAFYLIITAEAGGGSVMTPHREGEIISCSIDVVMGLTHIARAAELIKIATIDCDLPKAGDDRPALCAASVLSILGSFTALGSFITDAVSKCSTQTSLPMECTSGALKCASNVLEISSSISGMTAYCKAKVNDAAAMTSKDKQSAEEGGMCAINVVETAFMLARAKMLLHRAIGQCPLEQKDGDLGRYGSHMCMADTSGILDSLMVTGSWIAAAASQCAPDGQTFGKGTACASEVMKMLGGFGAVASSAGQMAVKCNPENYDFIVTQHLKPNGGVSVYDYDYQEELPPQEAALARDGWLSEGKNQPLWASTRRLDDENFEEESAKVDRLLLELGVNVSSKEQMEAILGPSLFSSNASSMHSKGASDAAVLV